jgi:hypothetical protein
MSSTVKVTPSTFNIQLIIDALADYAKITGIDLSNNPLLSHLNIQILLRLSSDYSRNWRRLLKSIAMAIGD